MNETKQHPGWKVALQHILAAHEEAGFGIVFSHEQLKDWMDIPTAPADVDSYKKAELAYMTGIDKLKSELAAEHHLWLEIRHAKGYELLHPNDQVQVAPNRHMRKARREISRAMSALYNVQEHLLDAEAKDMQIKGQARLGFIASAFRKRKIYQLENK